MWSPDTPEPLGSKSRSAEMHKKRKTRPNQDQQKVQNFGFFQKVQNSLVARAELVRPVRQRRSHPAEEGLDGRAAAEAEPRELQHKSADRRRGELPVGALRREVRREGTEEPPVRSLLKSSTMFPTEYAVRRCE